MMTENSLANVRAETFRGSDANAHVALIQFEEKWHIVMAEPSQHEGASLTNAWPHLAEATFALPGFSDIDPTNVTFYETYWLEKRKWTGPSSPEHRSINAVTFAKVEETARGWKFGRPSWRPVKDERADYILTELEQLADAAGI